MSNIEAIKSKIPQDHMYAILKGGFKPSSPEKFLARDLFFLKTYGCYMEALVTEKLQPVGPIQRVAVSMMKGEIPAVYDFATTWKKFLTYEKDNQKNITKVCY